MLQRLIGLSAAISGIYYLLNNEMIWGLILLILGAAFYNGADHDSWFYFEFSSGDNDAGDGGD